jgi:tetratricopeptide (TPR) repeat protein
VLESHTAALQDSQDRAAVRDVPEQVTALQQTVAGLPGEADRLEAALLVLRVRALFHLNQLGDSFRQAIAIGKLLADDAERLLGPGHADTLTVLNNLANAYGAAGRTADAITLHERTVTERERLLDPDHPDILQSRNNLALAYVAAGRTADAVTLHERTLADMERILGADHPVTLISQNNLALAYLAAGRVAEAIELHQCTLADRERVLGADHPDTLVSRNNLALAYQRVTRRHWWGLRRRSSP